MVELKIPTAETKNFIVPDKYTSNWDATDKYQSENNLERELVEDLIKYGYEFLPDLTNPSAMLANVRVQISKLNNVTFTENEWKQFVETYLDKPNEGTIDKIRKIHDDNIHDFVFENGTIQNIYLIDKKNIARNKLQVINQFEQVGDYTNRYDVTILVNGLPFVQIELKKRGVAIREAFNQIHRYSKESFNSKNSLYKFLQLFVISNGTDTRYFANTTGQSKNSFDFTMNWSKSDNLPIKDLKDFTATFLQKCTLLSVLIKYSVFDVNNKLLIMRPYQISATERILWKINSSYEAKNWSNPESGGFIWHTTGSGKTLTSFKAARLATKLEFIDKVFFVVDRKDLDFQTMKEYQRFSPDSVNGSDSTSELKSNLNKDDNKIIVTTIQKLNNLMKAEGNLPVYRKQVVFIFDECHRSQFGEVQKNLKKKFKRYYQFGFTGTPIFKENALGVETTEGVFGNKLHSYVITDAIRDKKVLKFKVDYNDVRPHFKVIESEQNVKKLNREKSKKALLHPERIEEISKYILNNFHQKTHRLHEANRGFNAMFAVSSIDAAKLYYDTLNRLQKGHKKPLKIATIFSFAPNEEQGAFGEILEENFDVSNINTSAKEFLCKVINDYNALFNLNYSADSTDFQNYYNHLAKSVRSKDIDLLIVVGMFLTGFDAPSLNTLFVDKNLRYHGLMQAFSRTNRILDSTKSFGNIVTFRNLEKATIDAITLFGDKNMVNVVLENSYDEYMKGFHDMESGTKHRGFIDIVNGLKERFPNPSNINNEADKKDFVNLFGEYLRVENVLRNYDEFSALKAFQSIDSIDRDVVKAFKEKHNLTNDDFRKLREIELPSERQIQDYQSTYNDIRDWLTRERSSDYQEQSNINWDDVVFEVDLLKSQEINLDYILELIFEKNRKLKDKKGLISDTRRAIRSSLTLRGKESLLVDFINEKDLDQIEDKVGVLREFFSFAQTAQRQEAEDLIKSENLNPEAARRYIAISTKREFVSINGTDLNAILPPMSPLDPQYLTKKKIVFDKVSNFVDKFKGVGGSLH